MRLKLPSMVKAILTKMTISSLVKRTEIISTSARKHLRNPFTIVKYLVLFSMSRRNVSMKKKKSK